MSYKRRQDVVTRGLARKLEQYRSAPKLDALITAYLAQVQLLEDGLWSVYRSRFIDDAAGASLDAIGAMVGRARNGQSDALYRAFIRTQVIANRSAGRVSDLVAIGKALFGQNNNVTVVESIGVSPPVRAIEITVTGIVDPAVAPYVGQILKSAKAIGVSAVVRYATAAPVFSFAGGGTGTAGFNVGKLSHAE